MEKKYITQDIARRAMEAARSPELKGQEVRAKIVDNRVYTYVRPIPGSDTNIRYINLFRGSRRR